MGLLDIFKTDIDKGVKECREAPGAVLLDVRPASDFAAGHIPGAVNIPLKQIAEIRGIAADPDTPLYVYCLRGVHSAAAVRELKAMGYTRVRNIGGINGYSGVVEK